MAYKDECAARGVNCDAGAVLVEPQLCSTKGPPRGSGATTDENNAKMLNSTAYTVANFRHPVELTVQSTYPAAGVSITASPADNYGASDGTTGTITSAFTYNQNTSVTLTAPANNTDGFPLSHWSGCTRTSGTRCTVAMGRDRTVTANYTTSNYLPTLNAISNRTITEDAGLQTVALSGITAGPGQASQTLAVTAVSSDTGLIPDPTVIYISRGRRGVCASSRRRTRTARRRSR